MRKIAQEVTKAVAEQGRASRDIIKAAQATTQAGRAGPQGDRRAGEERGGDRAGDRVDAARRGRDDQALAASRPSSADEIVARRRTGSRGMVGGGVDGDDGSRARAAARDRAASGESMRQQAEQAARALKEQARAMKDMTTAVGQHREADQGDHPRQPRALRGGGVGAGRARRDAADRRPQRHRREADRAAAPPICCARPRR